jgi:hypothetical protein
MTPPVRRRKPLENVLSLVEGDEVALICDCDHLTRENIEKQAAILRDLRVGLLLPVSRANTSATYRVVSMRCSVSTAPARMT